jgi:hypothetical protein
MHQTADAQKAADNLKNHGVGFDEASFGYEDAKRVIQPVLAVVGALSLEGDPIWGERQRLLLDWLSNVEPFVLPRATHLLEVEIPAASPGGWLPSLLATRSPCLRNRQE